MRDDIEKNVALMLYYDVYARISALTDEQYVHVMRAACEYGFLGKEITLTDPLEVYAANDLASTFDRSREAYMKKKSSGQVNAAIKYAKSEEDLKCRLAAFDGLTNYDISDACRRWREKRK